MLHILSTSELTPEEILELVERHGYRVTAQCFYCTAFLSASRQQPVAKTSIGDVQNLEQVLVDFAPDIYIDCEDELLEIRRDQFQCFLGAPLEHARHQYELYLRSLAINYLPGLGPSTPISAIAIQ